MNENEYETIRPIEITAGAEVWGEKFFGRDNELDYLLEILSKPRSSVIIPGSRRWGKSSFIKEFRLRNEENFTFCYMHLHRTQSIKDLYGYFLDIIKLRNPTVFVLKSAKKLKEISNTFTSIIKKAEIKEIGIETGKIEDREPEELLKSAGKILRLFPEKKIILVLDEISDFLNDLDENEAVLFLKWLRALRQESGVQMILTGSININATVRKLQAEDLIGDMQIVRLKPMEEKESIVFFKSLLKSRDIKVTGEALDLCSGKIKDGIHYFIQVFADEIGKNFKRGDVIGSGEKIGETYKDLLRSELPSFSNYHTRIDEYFEDNAKTAKKILINLAYKDMDFDEIFAVAGEMVSDDEQHLFDILKRLCDEGYLNEESRNFSFLSVFLSDYWREHYYYEK